jgi:hypothetical protein
LPGTVFLTSDNVVVNNAAKAKAAELGMEDWNCDDADKALPEW